MSLLVRLPIEDAREGGIFSSADEPRLRTPFGDWSLASFMMHREMWEWCVVRDRGRKVLEHSTVFTSCIRAGDRSWGDYTLEFEVRQMHPQADTSMDEMFNTRARSGVMFRSQGLRQAYALYLDSQEQVVLACRNGLEWAPLATRELTVDPAKYYRLKVTCKGERITCWMDGEPLFDVTDSTFRRGRIACYANTITRYGFLEAETDLAGDAEIAAYVSSEQRAIAESAEGLPEPVLWKRIPYPDGGSKPPCKIALDLSPQGKLEGVFAVSKDPAFAERGRAALVSVDIDGNVRWVRPADAEAQARVWDVDGDGSREVLLHDGPMLRLLDAATGEVKLEAPTPPCNEAGNRGGREDQEPHIPVYKMYPANVRGLGAGRDIVLMDMYTAFWVLNDKLEVQWWRSREHGHDLGIHDIDGDGRDEIMCGYVLFDDDGRELWEVAGTEYMIHTHHHVDHIAIGEFDGDPGSGLEIVLTGGNAGVFLVDQEGKVRANYDVGHAQALSVGRYRPDLPGKQILIGCLWGNPGCRTMFTGKLEKLWTYEPDNANGYDTCVRWAPDRDLFLLVSTPAVAGLYDGFGRRVIPFSDAHLSASDRPYCAADFNGDGLDEFVIRGRNELLVYSAKV